MLREQFTSERASLSRLRGRLGVAIPEIVCEGERDLWPYLIITRLPGILGTHTWPSLSEDQRERVLTHLGETIAQVQRVPPDDLLGIEPRWEVLMRGQIEAC
jgi:hygromycin-B 7''-O-kinase